MKTQISELLGMGYPIIQGGMHWVGRAELASAISNGGGLGVLIGLTHPTPEALAAEYNAAAAELMERIVSQAREVFEQRQAIFGAAADRERHA